MCRGVNIPYFKINGPIFCYSPFFEECLNPQARINKMVNNYNVNYHLRPSELTSSIHPLLFLWTPKEFISPEYFLNFFSNLYILPWLWKSFNFMALRLLENTFVSQKIESVHFYSCYQAKLSSWFFSSPLQPERNYLFPPSSVFWKSIFPQQKRGRGRIMELKNDQH